MNKKILVISSLVLIALIVSIIALFYSDNDKVIIESGKNNTIVRSNAITMMYETGYQTGEYQVTSDNAWPESGYTFNETLSKCENGSKIYWDSNTNRVMMEATTADKCYVYFNVVVYMNIDDISISSTHNRITVNVSDISTNTEILNYHYAINDSEYITTNSNIYSFENLDSNTIYSIKVYTTSVDGEASNVFSAKTITGAIHKIIDITFENPPGGWYGYVVLLDDYYNPPNYIDNYNDLEYILQNERRNYASSEDITSYLGETYDFEGNIVILEEALGVLKEELIVSDFTIIILNGYEEQYSSTALTIASETNYDVEDNLLGIFVTFSREVNNDGEMIKTAHVTDYIYITDYGEIEIYDLPHEFVNFIQDNSAIFLIVSS